MANNTSLSIEAQWQYDRDRRRRIIKFMLLVLLIFISVLILLWFWLTQPMLSRTTTRPEQTVDPLRLETHVRKLSQELVPRDESHLENLDRAAAYIKDELAQTGATVSEQPYRVEGKSYRNVIAQFGPDTDERIVVGAHYDTAGPLPGAMTTRAA